MESETMTVTEKPAVEKVDSLAKLMTKNWTNAKKAKDNWDFRGFHKAKGAYSEEVAELAAIWPDQEVWLDLEVEADTEYVRSEKYAEDIDQALKEVGLPLQGSFPEYEFPPFKLSFDVKALEVKLIMGRKKDRTTAMQPKQVAEWASRLYQAMVGKRFDAAAFMKDLRSAYQIANKIVYREADVKWGMAVHLDTIYELLTVKKSARSDYQKPLFIFELGRLREQFDLTSEGYSYELGFARHQEKALVVIDSQGRDARLASLTIHKVEK